jgi:broad specificity phosphatase PhoE
VKFEVFTRRTQLNQGKYGLESTEGSNNSSVWFHFITLQNTIICMKRIFFARHGESQGNKDGLICGKLDTPLTQRGEKQASLLGKSLVGLEIEMIISSDLQRAKKTAQIIAEEIDVDIQLDERLRERSCGKFDGMVQKEIEDDEDWNRFLRTPNYAVKEGESLVQLYDRIGSFVEELVREKEFNNILLTAHGGVLWVMIPYILGIPIEKYSGKIGMDNCGLSVFTWDDGFVLERMNCISHLGECENRKPSWKF